MHLFSCILSLVLLFMNQMISTLVIKFYNVNFTMISKRCSSTLLSLNIWSKQPHPGLNPAWLGCILLLVLPHSVEGRWKSSSRILVGFLIPYCRSVPSFLGIVNRIVLLQSSDIISFFHTREYNCKRRDMKGDKQHLKNSTRRPSLGVL